MPTHAALSTSVSVTADQPKGRKATDLFRTAYDKVGLNEVRAQTLNEHSGFPVALRRIIEEYSMPVAAPRDGRLHLVRVPVNPGRDWKEAINAAGPDTGKDWDIHMVGDNYPVESGEPKECEVILVNFGKTIPNTQYALDWAKPLGLRPASPRTVFAIGEHKPELHKELGVDVLVVVSAVPCTFRDGRRGGYVWWRGSKRYARLFWFAYVWFSHDWFAFVRE